jgi:hypothetical protein
MTSTIEAVSAIARRTGLPDKRVRACARALTDAGILPAGSPGKSPELNPEHVVSLLIGSCLDLPLRAVADAVRAYRALTPGGVSLEGAPPSISAAGDALDIWADIAVHGEGDILRREKIEIVSSWPEIALHETSGVKRWQLVSAHSGHWQAAGYRSSTTINGAALVDALQDLFSRTKN